MDNNEIVQPRGDLIGRIAIDTHDASINVLFNRLAALEKRVKDLETKEEPVAYTWVDNLEINTQNP